jgi:hypothetical protein
VDFLPLGRIQFLVHLIGPTYLFSFVNSTKKVLLIID